MTTNLRSVFGSASPKESQVSARTHAILLVMMAALAIVLLSASTTHRDPIAVDLGLRASAAPTSMQQDMAEREQVKPQALVLNHSIEALAGVIAKKYRISEEATREFVGTAYREGKRTGLDPLLIVAVMAVESRFNPVAQSDFGALGLMQVIPKYHSDKFDAAGGESVLDPETNIQIGARILKDYIRRGGDEVAGLQLYNGSIADESNAYANKVLGEKSRLQEAVRRVRGSLKMSKAPGNA